MQGGVELSWARFNSTQLRPAGSSWEKGVCQSVCLSVCQTHKTEHWDKRKKDLSSSLHHTKGHLAYTFWEEEWLVGRPLLPKILGQPAPIVGAKFPILNRYSLVATQTYM